MAQTNLSTKQKETHTENRLVVARGMWEGEGRIRRVGLVGANYCISSVQSLSRVQFFVTPWTVACQASLSITNSQSLLRLMSIELVMPSNISSFVVPFSCWLQSFPVSESFQMSRVFASGGQSIEKICRELNYNSCGFQGQRTK